MPHLVCANIMHAISLLRDELSYFLHPRRFSSELSSTRSAEEYLHHIRAFRETLHDVYLNKIDQYI